MRLRTRLIVQGAIVPVILLAAALGVAGVLFDRSLHQAIDRALLTQAGIESVSLFDRADAPHLHLSTSPMDTRVRELAPVAALYGPDGRRLTVYPEGARAPESLDPQKLHADPELSTEDVVVDDAEFEERRRVLQVRVDAPDGRPYGLWLAASLERHDRSVREFWRLAGVSVVASLVVLLGLQVRNSETLHRRLLRLQEHMLRLRRGELSGRPEPDDVGDVVSELRDAIADATVRLEAASAARDRLVANAAHELRTPLAAIGARVDVTRRRTREVGELEQVLDDVRGEVDRLAALAKQLLDLAAIQAGDEGRTSQVDLWEVLDSAVDHARMLLEPRDISVSLRDRSTASAVENHEQDLRPALRIQGRTPRLRQALDNLLENAGKYAPEGSVIDVLVSSDGRLARVEVVDRGPGIGELDPDAIFEPFFRGARDAHGTGLGLAIVREVAEAHGGRAYVDRASHETTGACFVLELPVA